MGTLFFVHGTGVRGGEFEATYAAVMEGARQNGLGDLRPVGCNWGKDRQDYPELIEDILPQAPDRLTDQDGLFWEVLVAEPLLELGLLPAACSTEPADGPEESGTRDEVTARIDDLPALDVSGVPLSSTELTTASQFITTSMQFRAAVNDPRIGSALLADASARAIAAALLSARREQGVSIAGSAQPSPVDIARHIAVAARGESMASRGVPALVLDIITGLARKCRYPLTKSAIEFVGDILFYAKRGDSIRVAIREAITRLDPPVLAIGHSLGGVMLVDVLTESGPPDVKLLVTVGSQSPALYAVDALGTLRPGLPQPALPRWSNGYDRSDLISFMGGRVFDGVDDFEVDSHQPFPESHGAYWSNEEFWQPIKRAWDSIGEPRTQGEVQFTPDE